MNDRLQNDDWWEELHPFGKLCFLIVLLGTGLFGVIAVVFVFLGLFH
ncbi:MAG: hypothetical protein OXG24_04155 [Gammaproteobacteria bacterium]|nr:hypothetical protein [Gammaproteobacteria bacterium]